MRMQGWGVKTVAGLGMFAGWFLACAGDDIPPIEDDLRGALEQEFGGAPAASAGSGGSGTAGQGGSGAGGSGTSGSGNAGSANAGSGNSGGGAAGAGGGEPVGGGGGGVDAPDCDAFPILAASCAISSGCHGANSPYGDFADNEDAINEYLDKPSVDSDCDSLVVDTANPADSLLYTKLGEDWPRACGNLQMPAAGDFLTEEETLCVLGWLGRFAE
jgi:hypothetical protein